MQKEVKIQYKRVGSFELNNVLQKIRNTPTDNKIASHVNHVFKQVTAAQKQLAEEYQKDIVNVYAKKDADGKLLKPEKDREGFVPPDDGTPEFEAFLKAQDDFGDRVAVIKWAPLTSTHLKDIKISAKEIDALDALFIEENAPGLPDLEALKVKLVK